MRTWKAFGADVRALAFAPDGSSLAVASAAAGVKLFDVPTGRERWHFNPSSFAPRVRFTGDGDKVVTLVKQRIAVLGAADGRELARHSRMLADFAVASEPDELLAVTAAMDTAELRRLKLLDGAVVWKKILKYRGGIARIELSPDGRTVATLGDREVLAFDAVTRELLYAWPLKPGPNRQALAFAPGSVSLAFAAGSELSCADIGPPSGTRGRRLSWPRISAQRPGALRRAEHQRRRVAPHFRSGTDRDLRLERRAVGLCGRVAGRRPRGGRERNGERRGVGRRFVNRAGRADGRRNRSRGAPLTRHPGFPGVAPGSPTNRSRVLSLEQAPKVKPCSR